MEAEEPKAHIGHIQKQKTHHIGHMSTFGSDITLNKVIFSNVFGKDIRRAYIYKKTERLSNALQLIAPAFQESTSLKAHVEECALAIVRAAGGPTTAFQNTLARELLTLSSIISMAKTGRLLSPMNADLLLSEVRLLLGDVGDYEEPSVAVGEAPTIAMLARGTSRPDGAEEGGRPRSRIKDTAHYKGQSERTESILSLIKRKRTVSIKDISTVILGVSEKTIQRELAGLVASGRVVREGERRWSTYSLP